MTMTDFAKYAFNKSHAAAYAVVAYQTAFLKYYYQREFMAALMTSVMDNTTKVSRYILACRNIGIPDPAAGYQRGIQRLLRIRKRYPLRTFRHQECRPGRGGRDHRRA